jgi:BirA family biotin operon repressor/biotin-[acetyl-CoA-carboxylase] ligase
MTAGADAPGGGGIIRLGVVDSTQSVALALAEQGAADGTVVVADSQRAGRGRLSRRWYDEPGSSLLCSILIRPRLLPARWPLLSLATGVAVARALQRQASVEARLKWPNDVMVDGRKLAGVLVESRFAPPPAAAIGVGINVGQERFPGELGDRATSIRLVTGCLVAREALLQVLLEEVTAWRHRLEQEGFAPVRAAWMALSATMGTDVCSDGVRGRAVDLDADGALLIDDGRRRHRLVGGALIEDGSRAARG